MLGFRGFLAAIVFLGVVFPAPSADKKQKPKSGVVEMRELKVTLNSSKINIDGVVHNSGDRAVEKLVLSFHFFDTEHRQLTILNMEVDEESLAPGEDAEIHAMANEPARAVSMEVSAAAHEMTSVKVLNAGPYTIE